MSKRRRFPPPPPPPIKFASEKYPKTTQKFIDILFSTYQGKIDIESMLFRSLAPFGKEKENKNNHSWEIFVEKKLLKRT